MYKRQAKWVGDEIQMRLKNQGIELKDATKEHRNAAVNDVDDLHKRARELFAKAANELKIEIPNTPVERPKMDFAKVSQTMLKMNDDLYGRKATDYEKSVQAKFISKVEGAIKSADRDALRAGDANVLKEVIPAKKERLEVMKAYFVTTQSLATEAKKAEVKPLVQKFTKELHEEKFKAEPNQPNPTNKTGPKL